MMVSPNNPWLYPPDGNGHENSNGNGQVGYGGAAANGHANGHVNGNGHNGHGGATANGHANGNGHAQINGQVNGYGGPSADGNANSNGHSNGHPHSPQAAGQNAAAQ